MSVILVKAIDFQVMNRYYSRKLQFLSASNLCKIAVTFVLGGHVYRLRYVTKGDYTRSTFLILVPGAGCTLATGEDSGQSEFSQERAAKLLA